MLYALCNMLFPFLPLHLLQLLLLLQILYYSTAIATEATATATAERLTIW